MTLSQSLRSVFAANVALTAIACVAPVSAGDLQLPAGTTISAGGNGLVLSNSTCSSYTVSGTTLTCGSSPGGQPGAPNCTSLTATPNANIPSGSQVQLSATCGVGALSYKFTGPGLATVVQSSPNLPVQNVTQGGIYSVWASADPNAQAGDTTWGNSATATVSVQGANPSPGGTPDCSALGYTNTKVIEAAFPANGGHQNLYFTSSFGNLVPKTAMVIHFKAPASDAYFRVSMVTDTGISKDSFKTVILSHSAQCDFAPPTKPLFGEGDWGLLGSIVVRHRGARRVQERSERGRRLLHLCR